MIDIYHALLEKMRRLDGDVFSRTGRACIRCTRRRSPRGGCCRDCRACSAWVRRVLRPGRSCDDVADGNRVRRSSSSAADWPGLAATSALIERGCRVELFESRTKLGGRAASFRDPATGDLIDHCQHVGMACCTNLVDFCRRTGIADYFVAIGRCISSPPTVDVTTSAAAPLLPAPLHLMPSLLRLGYLTWRERLGIGRAMLRLARTDLHDDRRRPASGCAEQGQSPQAIERFWAPVIVSALGEAVERASFKYMRKVFVDGFLTNRIAYEIDVPTVALGDLYGERLEASLRNRGATIHCDAPIARIDAAAEGRLAR